MKKLLLLLCFLFLFFASNAQYPVTQFIGADSTLVKSRGGLQGRFAPIPFTDTAQANTSRIRQYPGALIYTSGVDKYWYRNSTMTGWVEFTSSGGATTNIYNSDGVLTGNRQLGGSGFDLRFNDLKELGIGADSSVFSLTSGIFRINGLILSNDTSTYKPLGYDPITGKVVTRSSWIGGGGGSGLPTKFDSSYTPLGGNRGSEYIVKSVRIRRNNITVNPTQIGDSAMYWNIDVPDSSTFATIYRTDTMAANIRDEISSLPTPTLQQVLNEGNELSGFSYINATNSNTDYLSLGGGTYFYDIGLFAKHRLNFFTANGSSQDTASFFDLYQDSIQIKPWKGGLYIDSLNSGSATDSVLVWDASTGLVKKRNASAFSGGGGGVTTIGTINGTTKSANGGVISGSTLYLQTVDATYPGLMTSAQKARLDSNSYLTIDKTYDSLAWRRNDSTFLTKSLRIQLNGSTVTPTTTDSTLSYNLIVSAGSPAGNYGNVQLNRNGSFATPGSDSLDFDAGLIIKGILSASALPTGGVDADSVVVINSSGAFKKRNVSAFAMMNTASAANQLALFNGNGTLYSSSKFVFSDATYPSMSIVGSDPLMYFGGTGASYPSLGKSGNSLAFYGPSTGKSIGFYDQLVGGKQMLRLYTTSGSVATFSKTAITLDTAVGGPSIGSVHVEYNAGDSTSAGTDVGRHMFRGIGRTYANAGSFNTFYSTVEAGNTTYSQDHIISWQSDAKKTGANTLNIIYHLGILGDSIKAGTVNNRWGVYMYDAKVTAGATLAHQSALRVPKLLAGSRNYDMFSDSAQTVKMDGNILLGDSVLATSARKTLHIFNGTAPSASVANGVILYAEDVSSSSELKVRDEAGNITTLSPHNFSRIPNGKSEDMAWSYYSEKDGKVINVDMLKAIRTIEQQSKEIEELKALVAALLKLQYEKKEPVRLVNISDK